jgi:hypothetical protein
MSAGNENTGLPGGASPRISRAASVMKKLHDENIRLKKIIAEQVLELERINEALRKFRTS